MHAAGFTSRIGSTKTGQESETVQRTEQDYMARTGGEEGCKQPPRTVGRGQDFALL